MSREDTLYQLNKDFVQQDTALIKESRSLALIKDVAESCLYDYGKSYEALANLFHGNSLMEQPKLLQSVLVPTEEVVDQQTMPEMPRILPVGSDQSVPNNGASYAARFNGTGPKPNSGAIRKSAVFNHKQWAQEEEEEEVEQLMKKAADEEEDQEEYGAVGVTTKSMLRHKGTTRHYELQPKPIQMFLRGLLVFGTRMQKRGQEEQKKKNVHQLVMLAFGVLSRHEDNEQ